MMESDFVGTRGGVGHTRTAVVLDMLSKFSDHFGDSFLDGELWFIDTLPVVIHA